MPEGPGVIELRLVVTAPDYDEALRLYRDVLGLREREAHSPPEAASRSSRPDARRSS